MKFLNIMQNLAIFQAFILGVISSIAYLAWRRDHFLSPFFGMTTATG
jgi:hypothetical protein